MAAITALGWAQESTFASIDSSTGLPSSSGLTFTLLDADEMSFEAEDVKVERADATRRQTAEGSDTVGQGGGATIRRGTITITKEVMCPGTDAVAAYDVAANIFTAAALNTLFSDGGAPAAQTDAVATAGTAKQWVPTTIGNGMNGDIVGFVLNGKARSGRISARSGGTDWLLGTALPSAPALAAVGRFARSWYANTGWSTNSLAFLMDGVGGQRLYGFGAKLQDLEFRADEAGRVVAVLTLRIAYVQPDNSNYDLDSLACDCSTNHVSATAFDGGVRVASQFCGKGGDLASPANSDMVSSFSSGLWTLTLSAPLSMNAGTNGNNIGIHQWRVGTPTVSLTLPMCETLSTFDSDRANNAKRQIIIDTGVGTEGAGFSIHLNGAQLMSDPQVWERDEEEYVQTLVFKSGEYCNDTTGANAGPAANAWLSFSWWL